MAERFAWFGVRSNMVSYLTGPMGQSTATAVVNVNVLIGTADLSPLLGSLVGDAILGRYRAFVVASFFSVLVSDQSVIILEILINQVPKTIRKQ